MVSTHTAQPNRRLDDEPLLRYLLSVPEGEPPAAGWPEAAVRARGGLIAEARIYAWLLSKKLAVPA